MPDAFKPGPIVHVSGKVLGEHQGLNAFTIGQRKGLGVAWTEPLFVIRLDMANNTVVLGERPHLDVQAAILRECTWHLGPFARRWLEMFGAQPLSHAPHRRDDLSPGWARRQGRL